MRSIACLCAGFMLVAATGFAQGVSTPMVGFDNFHIVSVDPTATRAWYLEHLGLVPAPAAGQGMFGKTLVVFLKNEKVQPSTGSTIDHLGISVADVDAKIKELTAAGATVVSPAADIAGVFRAGFVRDPWGVKIEVLNDPDARGLHHMHLRVKDPQATLAWYEQMLGGERTKLKGRIDGLKYGSTWLLVADSGGEATAASADRAIQHIAWRVPHIDAARTALMGHSIKVGDARPYQDVRFSLLEDPNGVRVQIIERPHPFASNAATPLGYDNVHLRVSDPAKAREWYVKYLGANSPGGNQIMLGKVPVVFVKVDATQPSAGSVIDHIGLSYANLAAKMKDFEAGGAKILQAPRDVPGLFKLGFIEDPWGVKFEVLEDPDLIGFHHIHLRVRDPQATLAWYEQMLGGERAKLKGQIEGIRYGEVWLLAASSGTETPVPSAERAIQNLAWSFSNVDEAATALKSRGAKATTEPTSAGKMRFAFIEDPNGVKFELFQRPIPQ